LISNKEAREAIALMLIAIAMIVLAYLVTTAALRYMPAPFGSFEELMKP
jgi:putative copper export protein